MIHYAIYERRTGRIQMTGNASTLPEAPPPTFNSASRVLEVEPGVSGATHYVDMATMTVKPKERIDVQVNGSMLSNLPAGGCTLTIDGQSYECPDVVANITFNLPGEYTVTVRAVRFLDAVVTVSV